MKKSLIFDKKIATILISHLICIHLILDLSLGLVIQIIKKSLLGVNYTLISNIKDLNYSNYINKEIYTNSSKLIEGK